MQRFRNLFSACYSRGTKRETCVAISRNKWKVVNGRSREVVEKRDEQGKEEEMDGGGEEKGTEITV